MSKAAAQSFIGAVKATKADYQSKTSAYYKKFIVGKEVPKAKDVKDLGQIIKEMKEVAAVYHGSVVQAIAGFGGSGDSDISGAEAMLHTIAGKAKD